MKRTDKDTIISLEKSLNIWFGITRDGRSRIIIHKAVPLGLNKLPEELFDYIHSHAQVCIEAGLDELRMHLLEDMKE